MTVDSVTTEPIYYDPYDYELDRDPHRMWARMRDEQPLYWNERFEFWAFSRFDDVWRFYQDTATFSSAKGITLDQLRAGTELPSIIFMDPPEHDVLRKLVGRAFTPRRMGELESFVVTLVDDLLDQVAGSDSFDYVQGFGALVPPMVIGELLGVPAQDRDQLRRWFDDLLHHEEGSTDMSQTMLEAAGAVYEYTSQMIAERRKHPTDDLVTALVESEVDDGGNVRRLDEFEIGSFVALLAGAGVETVARLLSWAAVVLARHPEERSLLVDEPALVRNAVEELLRYEAPSPVNGRTLTRSVEAYGETLPAGSRVLLLNGSANRDPREFEDPDRFDVRRKVKRHLGFGIGPHFCLGAALARMEARIALERTLARFPHWDVDEAELVPVHTITVRGYHSVPIHVR